MGQFSVPAYANQPPGFCVRGTSTPNRLFKTINGLKTLMGYTIVARNGKIVWKHESF